MPGWTRINGKSNKSSYLSSPEPHKSPANRRGFAVPGALCHRSASQLPVRRCPPQRPANLPQQPERTQPDRRGDDHPEAPLGFGFVAVEVRLAEPVAHG